MLNLKLDYTFVSQIHWTLLEHRNPVIFLFSGFPMGKKSLCIIVTNEHMHRGMLCLLVYICICRSKCEINWWLNIQRREY
jgi:hypothetical protein